MHGALKLREFVRHVAGQVVRCRARLVARDQLMLHGFGLSLKILHPLPVRRIAQVSRQVVDLLAQVRLNRGTVLRHLGSQSVDGTVPTRRGLLSGRCPLALAVLLIVRAGVGKILLKGLKLLIDLGSVVCHRRTVLLHRRLLLPQNSQVRFEFAQRCHDNAVVRRSLPLRGPRPFVQFSRAVEVILSLKLREFIRHMADQVARCRTRFLMVLSHFA
mmetsp:Transcript_28621/g.66455  ORF Transcript_28621/g.66455 Transcript_28621/m.66455 type:complete len:216 (+) Transcript_28621:3723-4370(+)